MFDFGQSNSEHSRHWFFKGKIVIDGEEQTEDLMNVVGATMNGKNANDNSLIAFHDNSSAIRGYQTQNLQPREPGNPSEMTPTDVVWLLSTSHLASIFHSDRFYGTPVQQ